jgi:hypothetical protein
MKAHWIKRGIFCGIAVIAGAFALGFVVMHLWNWLMPTIFAGAAMITYCQAFGILILARILFGGFRGRGGCGCGSRGGYWRNRFKGQWENMSEEEREKLRKSCGPSCCEPEEKK